MDRVEIKNNAKSVIEGRALKIFGNIILISIIFALIAAGVEILLQVFGKMLGLETSVVKIVKSFGYLVKVRSNTFYGTIVSLIKGAVTTSGAFGVSYYILNLIRGKNETVSSSCTFVKENIKNIMIVAILYSLIITIGYMLLVIPGIIATVGLIMLQPVLIDNPELSPIDAIKKAWELTNGHKKDIFIFLLSFIGWILSSVLLIPIVYVIPYMTVSQLLLYEKLRSA